MYGMMDPDMIRLAQEQMSRIPPDELMRMQQQMLSNPELVRMATEGMKNMKPEDFRVAAEQMKNIPPEQIADMSTRMAHATPEQIAAMNTFSSAHKDYEFQGALMLKNQGNQLHGVGKYSEAVEKYMKAKENMAGATSQDALSLRLTCSLNLMSCYLKTAEYNKVIKEGTEVLASNPINLKALYRRGQAYKELRQFRLAVADLSEAVAIAPDDETVADVLRQAKEELEKTVDSTDLNRDGPNIEEITEEEAERLTTNSSQDAGTSVESTEVETLTRDASTSSLPGRSPHNDQTYAEALNSMKQNPEMLRNMHSLMSTVNPEQIAAISGGKMTSEMAKFAADLMKQMSPSDLERMVGMASGLRNSESTGGSSANDSSEVQSTVERMADLNGSAVFPQSLRPGMGMEEQMRKQMKDPAMKEMMAAMMKSMTPESMASMSEQLGLKLTPEQAVEAQKAMANLSPDQLDSLMRWAERAQAVTEQAKRAKAWLLGRPGLIFALVMLIIAIVLHHFGYIGGR